MRLLISGLICLVGSCAASAVVIDPFNDNQAALTLTFPPAGTTASSSVAAAAALGGERDISVNLTAGVIAGNTMSTVVSSGFFSYSQDATISGDATIQWDGADGSPTLNPTGLGGVDLTAAGTQDALDLNVEFDDLPLNVVLTVFTDAGNSSQATLALSGLLFSSTHFVVPFSSFTLASGAGANFNNVGAITMTMGSNVTAPDLVINSLSTTALLSAAKTDVILIDNGTVDVADSGDTVRYTVVLNNPDDAFDANATSVLFNDTPDSNTTLVVGSVTTSQGSVTSGNTAGNTTVSVDVGSIGDAASVSITFDVLVDSPLPLAVTQLSNQGQLVSSGATNLTDDPDTGALGDATLTPAMGIASADLSISKTDGTTTVSPNGSTIYTIVASNAGPDAAMASQVSDTFDAVLGCNWTCASAGGASCATNGSGNINETVNLPAGSAVTFTANCSISAAASGNLVNTATVAAAMGITDPNTADNSATDTDTVAAPGQLNVNPGSVSFGTVALGSSATQTVTLTNTGPSTLNITALQAANSPFALAGGSCSGVPITLVGGASCTLDYSFSPVASGPFNEMLLVTADAPGGTSILLSGSGGMGVIALLDATLDFGSQRVGGTSQGNLTLLNTGDGPLQITSIASALAPFEQVPGGSCLAAPFTLAAGDSCTIFYTFSPTTSGSFTQPVLINSDVGNVTATLRALGIVSIPVPMLEVWGMLMLIVGLAGIAFLNRRSG